MVSAPSIPVLTFYRRDGCSLCDEARDALQAVLEERVRRGDPIARVKIVNLSRRPEYEAAYGTRIPVIALGGDEVALVTSGRLIAAFLDHALGRLA